MGRFWAATRVVALFIMTVCCSPLAYACETCERVPLAAENTANEVAVAQLDAEPRIADISNGSDVIASAVDYLAAYDAKEPLQPGRMPSFRREHKWVLTYRSDAADAISQPAQSDRFPAMNTTLDDSIVLGLRFEWEYGWTR